MNTLKNYFRFGLLFAAVFAVSVIATPAEELPDPSLQAETNDIQEAPIAAQRLVRSAPVTRKPGGVKKTDLPVVKKKATVKKATGKNKPVAVLKKAGAKGKPAKKGATKTKTSGKPFIVKKKVASKGGKGKPNAAKKLPELKVDGVKNTVGVIG